MNFLIKIFIIIISIHIILLFLAGDIGTATVTGFVFIVLYKVAKIGYDIGKGRNIKEMDETSKMT